MSEAFCMVDADVFVIGGGPAGLAAAIAARRKGLRVVLADGHDPPVDKACGEGLMPGTRLAAAALGIEIPESAGVVFRGVRFLGEKFSVQADFPLGPGLGLRRTALHKLLVQAAEQAGVDLRWKTPVRGLHTVRAHWVIGADGASSRVRQWAGLDRYKRNSRRFAYRRHFAAEPWSRHIEIHWGEGCQIYITPTASREVCAALISRDPHLRLEEAVARYFPVLAARLGGAEPTSSERGAVTATVRLAAVACDNVALIGDASGSVDAITGEGIGLSFKQAAVLAEAMVADELPVYNTMHPRLASRPMMMANLMLTLDRGRGVRELALGALASAPLVFRKLLAAHVGA
ncbi:MAG: NAD(P)/FAD-dependent oxidoreductase [Acidobacteriota bacterium]